MNIFSTREIAIGIYILIFLIFISTNKATKSNLIEVIKAACTKKLVIPFLIIILYAGLFIFVLAHFKFWNWIYLKDIIIWVLFNGVPVCFNAVSKHGDEHYFKNIVKDNFKFTAFIEFFTGTFTFNIIVELLLQPVIILFTLLQTVASKKEEYKKVEILINFLISLIAILVLAFTFKTALESVGSIESENIIITFCLPIVLSVIYLPVAYLLMIYSKYELLFIRLNFKFPNDKKTIIKRQMKIIGVCGLSYERLCELEKECFKIMHVSMQNTDFESIIYNLKILFKNKRRKFMKSKILRKANKIIKMIKNLPNVKTCKLYGSLLNNTYDDFSNIDIEIDVSGCDNSKFIKELPNKLQKLKIIFSDYSSSSTSDTDVISIAIDEKNPFLIVNLKCTGKSHCKTINKENTLNNKYTHILKLWVDNLKHYYRGKDCIDDICQMAQKVNIKNTDQKEPVQLLEEVLVWLENNKILKFDTYVNSCREKFNKLVLKNKNNQFLEFIENLNKNSSAVTIILAILTPIFGALLTFMLYSYYHGYFEYFSISEVWLDLNSSNSIFYPIFMIFVGLAFLIFNAIPIILIKYTSKFGKIISIIIGVSFFAIIFGFIKIATHNEYNIILSQTLAIWLITYGIGLIDGFIDMISDYAINKGIGLIKERNLAKAIGTFILILCLIVEVFVCYSTGKSVAQNKNQFKVVNYNNEYMVILYETSEKFILAKSVIIENEDDDSKDICINTSEQIIIDNTEVNYSIINFDNININIE